MVGIITGCSKSKNRDGDKVRTILQVELIEDEDVRSVELFSQAGEDVCPANGCRVNVIDASKSYQIGVGVSDDLAPEVAAGEREIYSTNNPVTTKKARIKWGADGVITINAGTKSAVNYADLNTALQTLVTAINAALATKLDGSGAAGALTLNLTAAEVPKVKL